MVVGQLDRPIEGSLFVLVLLFLISTLLLKLTSTNEAVLIDFAQILLGADDAMGEQRLITLIFTFELVDTLERVVIVAGYAEHETFAARLDERTIHAEEVATYCVYDLDLHTHGF